MKNIFNIIKENHKATKDRENKYKKIFINK